MTYRAEASFKCDGCKVVTSEPVVLDVDILRGELPMKWLRVETSALDGDVIVRTIKHYCPMCTPLITSYLAGRREGREVGDDD